MNKRHIFLSTRNYQLSYALKWAIEKFYNAEVYFYAKSKNTSHPPVSEIASEIKRADLFVQILDYDNEFPLGSTKVKEKKYIFGQSETELPVIEWEYFYYLKNKKPLSTCRFIKLGDSRNEEIDKYIDKYGGIEKLPTFIPGNFDHILETIINCVADIALPLSNPHKTSLVNGYIDRTLDTTKILEEIRRAVKNQSAWFEQKYLYSTLIGAYYWKELVGNSSNNAYSVYNQFPYRLRRGKEELKTELTEFLDNTITKYDSIKKYGDYKKFVFYVIGCGSGNREAELINWLDEHFKIKEIEVVLIDIASELINISINNFKRRDIHNLHFAILDIESDNKKTFELLREFYTKKDSIACFLFLGNTLANIDEDVFLGELVDIMKPNDILFAEFLCEKDRASLEKIKGDKHIVQAGHIEKFKFTTNILKLIDIVPKPQNFYMKFRLVGAIGNGSALRREYYYKFENQKKFTDCNGTKVEIKKEYIKTKDNLFLEDKSRYYVNKEYNSDGSVNTTNSWNITNESRIELLKIDTYDEEYTNILFDNRFGKGNYLIQTKEYIISSDQHETTRMAYITAIKK